MYDFFKHKFFGAARAESMTRAPDAVPLVSANEGDPLEHARVYNNWLNGAPNPSREKRRSILAALHQDTEGERKRAWLRAQHPRIKKGDSGMWWCVSEHQRPTMVTPLGTKVFHRVGSGDTPREAYDAWMEF